MKKAISLIGCLLIAIILPLTLVGCTHGNYKFVGIIGEDGKTIVKTADIKDEEIMLMLEAFGYTNSSIDLKRNGTFEWAQVVGSKKFNTITTTCGEYIIEGEKIQFISSTTGEEEDIITIKHDFKDGKIVVYLSGIFLVYQK